MRVLTLEEVEKYLNLIRQGEGLGRAARRLGIDPSTMRQIRKLNSEFDAAVKAAEEEAAEPVEIVLYNAALRGEPWAVKQWLEHRSSDRWAPAARKVEATLEIGPTPALERILSLQAQLESRKAQLGIIEAEVLELE